MRLDERVQAELDRVYGRGADFGEGVLATITLARALEDRLREIETKIETNQGSK